MEQTVTCISCPVGCRLKVVTEGGCVTDVSGHGCKRGIAYAGQECIAPTRMVTAVVAVRNRKMPLSVKTERPIPKGEVFSCMREIEAAEVTAPIRMGQTICENVCGTGINVIATKAAD